MIVHKLSVYKLYHGLFVSCAKEIAREYPDVTVEEFIVDAIHDERGYRKIRRALGRRYDASQTDPMIEVVAVDLLGDRRLMPENPPCISPLMKHLLIAHGGVKDCPQIKSGRKRLL